MSRVGQPASDPSVRLLETGHESSASIVIEDCLSRLDETTDRAARANILLEVGLTMRDDVEDEAQALDAFIEAWRNDPNDDVLDAMEPLLRTRGRFREVMEETRTLTTTSE